MTDFQWKAFLNILSGTREDIIPTGFIIDSPWIPGWAGISTMDYFTSDELWFQTNLNAVDTFPDVWFLPGFWAEYGMCTEPSAFGARCSWKEYDLPYADRVIWDVKDIDRLTVPDPACDGLMPFALNRLKNTRTSIEKAGHRIRFAVVRGPLNVASFLMGATEFLISLRTDSQQIHSLLKIVTEYLINSILLQKSLFDSIEGILVLDDIVGFCGEPDFLEFAFPYLKEIFNCIKVPVRFLHNDADGNGCAPHLEEIGVNLFNFSFLHTMADMREKAGDNVSLFGNIPPRDVLAIGSQEEIRQSLRDSLTDVPDRSRLILSCGGGMPNDVKKESLECFLDEARRQPVILA